MDHNDSQKLSLESGNQHNGHNNMMHDNEKLGHGEMVDGAKGDPFGDETNAEVKYRTLEWWQAALIMIAETISLGILSLPSTLAAIGMIPGVILILGLGAIATYTGYTMGQFKKAYPHVHNMADAGEVLLGPIGREIFGAAQVIFLIFIMGSHILTFTIAMNVITGHPVCSVVWGVVATVILYLCTLPRTLKKLSYLSIAAFGSIFVAVIITMVAVGINKPDQHIQATVATSFIGGFGAVLNIIFAFAGHVAFFSFISELKNPNDFPKALAALQIADTSMYLVVAVVIYYYAGPNVESPALGSAGDLIKKIAYGIALPTILLAGVIYGHVNTKYIYVRIFRGTRHMSERSLLSIGTWAAIAFALWIVAWIIAESIPVFNNLVGFIAALFASWFTYTLSGVFWLFINKGRYFANWKKAVLTVVNVFIVIIGLAIWVLGLYASGTSIHDDKSSAVWSCAA